MRSPRPSAVNEVSSFGTSGNGFGAWTAAAFGAAWAGLGEWAEAERGAAAWPPFLSWRGRWSRPPDRPDLGEWAGRVDSERLEPPLSDWVIFEMSLRSMKSKTCLSRSP